MLIQEAKPLKSHEKQLRRFLSVLFVIAVSFRSAEAQAQNEPTTPAAQVQHQRKLVVSIPHRKLALVEDGRVKKVYPVAVGAAQSHSPTGTFQVTTRVVKPTYYHPGKVIPAGPGNPLGTRWIGLNTKGYGIHGTNIESSIGKAASHGCIRMHRKDLEELFEVVQVGDQVEIRAQADPEVATIFGDSPETSDGTSGTANDAGDQQ
jgi:lipoprotein-anchoring transpeptidase ErfK/SrfK